MGSARFILSGALVAACGSSSSALPDAAPALSFDASLAPLDALSDVDMGAPSKAYPAPHPPLPQLTNLAEGHVLTSPAVYLVLFPGNPHVTGLQDFATKRAQATYVPAATGEYGVGPLRYGGTIMLPTLPPAALSSADLQTWMAAELTSGALGSPDPQGIYTVVFPATTQLTEPNPVVSSLPPLQSCSAFGGYHDSVTLPGGPTVPYAVIATCTGSLDDLTDIISHEWVEAATDPVDAVGGVFSLTPPPGSAFFSVDADHTVWGIAGGSEAGDLCEFNGALTSFTPSDIGHVVQRTWSNARAAGSHDPCAPDPPGAYFNSAPVITEPVTVTSPLLSAAIATKGLVILPGASQTVEVDLFSDGDTGGPWSVVAEDLIFKLYGSYNLPETLAFQWDRTSGQNGEKLHLTITVTRGSVLSGVHAFLITSTLNGRSSYWPGLVVESP